MRPPLLPVWRLSMKSPAPLRLPITPHKQQYHDYHGWRYARRAQGTHNVRVHPRSSGAKDIGLHLLTHRRCDISQALVHLGYRNGGFLSGLTMWSPDRQAGSTKLIGPAYTVKYTPKDDPAPKLQSHYVGNLGFLPYFVSVLTRTFSRSTRSQKVPWFSCPAHPAFPTGFGVLLSPLAGKQEAQLAPSLTVGSAI